jgi:nitrite reductase/ring-hydroxylating ferredoxin subunit
VTVTADRATPRVSDLAGRTSPTLSDGIRLRDLIDFDRREVSMRVLRDPEIHRLELKRIFARSWIGLGHEGEIPNRGDFVTRYIGEDQVIMTRAKDGSVNVLLNVCAHRGMQVCLADEGNRSLFKCPYHGWTYDGTGALAAAPYQKEMYGDWDKSQFGLRTAKVELFQGRVFANFDPLAPSLDEWLGAAKWYLETSFGEGDKDMEIVSPPRRFVVHANWKVSADNNSGDTYHGVGLHRSLFELGMVPPDDRLSLAHCLKVSTAPAGHGVVVFADFAKRARGEELTDEDTYRLKGRNIGIMLFPGTFGVGGMQNMRQRGPDGKAYTLVQIGGIVPRGPDAFELWGGTLIERGAPDQLKDRLRAPTAFDLSGVDDYEGWPLIQRAAQGVIGEEQTMKYNAVGEPHTPEGFPGPGQVYAGVGKDDSQWNFWLRWYDLMTR